MKIKLGSHVSFKNPKYLLGSFEEMESDGSNTLMIYLGAPQNSKRVGIEKYNLSELKEKLNNSFNFDDLIVHGPYIVNLANLKNKDFNIDFMINEINKMNYIGCKYLVIHPGSRLDLSIEEGLKNIIYSLKEIIEKTEKVNILIETMAGKGTELCSKIEEIKFILEEVNSDRLGICLDTCHLWDAGYDIKTDLNGFITKLKDEQVLSKVKVIHLNDSKNDLSSSKDRHENIGKGKIGLEALRNFLYCKEFENIPFILETPYINEKSPYKNEIKLLLKK
ncbi:MAG: deoxyribonuclease IV [Metamycoplasmataceae bacterium]